MTRSFSGKWKPDTRKANGEPKERQLGSLASAVRGSGVVRNLASAGFPSAGRAPSNGLWAGPLLAGMAVRTPNAVLVTPMIELPPMRFARSIGAAPLRRTNLQNERSEKIAS
jgi:hypothetical protein